jgi:protease-4
MRDFIKFTFASCLGVFLAMLAFLFFFAILVASIYSATGGGAGGKKVALEKENVLTLDFSQPIPEQTNNLDNNTFSFNEQNIPGLHKIVKLIHHAAEDDKIKGILIENGSSALGSSSAKIILDALEEFKHSNKFIAAYGDYYTQQGYYLASAANHIELHPVGIIDFRGFASYTPFFKGLIDKLGLDVQIYYAGNFKSATEPLRRNDMSPESKLQTREYLTDTYAMYLEDIAQARSIDADSLKALAWAFKIKSAEDALQYKLVDEIGSKADCETWMNEQMSKSRNERIHYVTIDEYADATPLPATNYKAKDKIALVYMEGEIVSGHKGYGVIDDSRYVKLLKDIRRQDDIKAVVLRINSPGGSILSAENIYRQLQALKAEGKKLVVSMGDLAASGGYYLSAPADSIFAQPNTLTGSIGVFSIIPNPARALDEKLGIRFDTVRTGPYSADFTVMFPWSERENVYMQQRTEAYYEQFISKVAEGRHMTHDAVQDVAQGRIWSGKKALQLHLVDKLGTLEDAITSAATLAGIQDYRIKEYPVFQNPLQKFIMDLMDQDNRNESLISTAPVTTMMQIWEVMQSGEPQARLPFGFSIKEGR